MTVNRYRYRYIVIAKLKNGDTDEFLNPFWLFLEGADSNAALSNIDPDWLIQEANGHWGASNWTHLDVSATVSAPVFHFNK